MVTLRDSNPPGAVSSVPANSVSALADSESLSTRLFVSPLTPETLSIVLPPAQQYHLSAPPSFHTPQAFPEQTFGYLELPHDVAIKLRKKLHGTVLKGQKMRVEDARPDRGAKRKADGPVDEKRGTGAGKKTRMSGKKDQDGVLKGVQLPAGRRVKRGWEDGWVGTDTSMGNLKKGKKKKKGEKAQAGEVEDGQEAKMVFRTQVPPNKATEAEQMEEKRKGHKKGKRSKSSTTEVKEFENTEKIPTFLRSDKDNEAQGRTSFEDGKGWIDEDGNVVEPVKDSGRSSRRENKSKTNTSLKVLTAASLGLNSNSDRDKNTAPGSHEEAVGKSPTPQIAVDSTTPDADDATEPTPTNEPSALETLFKRPANKSKSKRPEPLKTFTFFDRADGDGENAQNADKDAAHATPDPDEPIHSATDEAPTSAPAARKKKFPPTRLASLQIPPQTPFTRRDLDARGLRSAAPTPDTAAIGKRMRVPWLPGRSQTRSLSREDSRSRSVSGPPVQSAELEAESAMASREMDSITEEENDEEEEEQEEEKDRLKTKLITGKRIKRESVDGGDGQGDGEGGKEQTEFEKQFYEQRGELNRAWKAQKREAKKKGRQVANRKSVRAGRR